MSATRSERANPRVRERRAAHAVPHASPTSVREAERRAACAALDAMRAARPLRPPPLPRDNPSRTPGYWALQREIAEGLYTK